MARLRAPLQSLNGLRAFEAAARHGSFTRAAAELNVSQGAVSGIVRSLEERLGFLLFERTPNHLVLTPQGKELCPVLSNAFEAISEALVNVSESSRGRRQLTVGVGGTFALRWLIPRLVRFHETHPDLSVKVAIGNTTNYFQDDWTCGIRFNDGDWTGYEVEPLFSPHLIPVCSPRLASELATPADLQKVTLLYVASALDDWSRWLKTASVPSVGATITLQTYAMALQAALDGIGVALALCPYVVEDLKMGRLVAPFPWTVAKGRSWALVYLPFRKSTSELAEFRRWLLDEIAASEFSPVFEFQHATDHDGGPFQSQLTIL